MPTILRAGASRTVSAGRVLVLVSVVALAIAGAVFEYTTHAGSGELASSQKRIPAAHPALSASPKPGWIIEASAISLLEGAGASRTLIDEAFNNDQTYVSGTASDIAADDVPDAVPTATFESYLDIKAAFADGHLPGKYKAVLYDNEHWLFTPVAEQDDPAYYEQLVAQLVHAHGMTYVATPAADLVYATGTLVDNNMYDTYLSRDIAGDAAKYADVLDIQAEGAQTDLPVFTSFADAAIQQARQANPHITVLVGIGTNGVTDEQLYAAYSSMTAKTDGYWLNIPGTSSYCPSCGPPNPAAGYYLLQKIYGLN